MKHFIERILFGAKWILILFYLGLIVAMVYYAVFFLKEIGHLVQHFGVMNKDAILMSILELVDITMIANLIKMIITGSYSSFVSKTHEEQSEHVSSGLLKVKMATSLVGVSSIHLLQTFIGSDGVAMEEIHKQLLIHGSFLVGALMLAVIDHIHESHNPKPHA